MLLSFECIAGKEQCKKYLEKLHQIQSLQRAGYSNKKGRLLVKREQKARDLWWKCQTGKLTKTRSTTKTYDKSQHSKIKPVKRHSQIEEQVFDQTKLDTKELVIQGKYQGAMQQAWLNYYQQPNKCRQPKTTSLFAYCIEHRREQQLIFEKEYVKVNNSQAN